MRRMLLGLVLAPLLGAADADDPSAALRLPASGPGLEAAAKPWRGREDELLKLLADPDPARRRGAARLAAAIPVEAIRLATALAGSDDREVRRLGALGLRGTAVEPALIAKLDDAGIAAALIALHPAPDPLADPALAAAAERWLADPASSGITARMIAARGTLARWSDPLLKALASPDAVVVASAHNALELMTRTQRSLDAYAGDSRLLVQDWRDVLAVAAPHEAKPDPELLGLVAELPAADALTKLLAKGAPALAAVEQAQTGADRKRRHDLEPAARLLAREVPVALWKELGAAAFADMDDPDAQRRIACLRALIPAIRKKPDPSGLLHLVAWLDDRDSDVRATALDQLVRLSDDKDKFGGNWQVADEALFPTGSTMRRLRHCLRDGGTDEQIAALLLVGTLQCGDAVDEVVQLLMSSRSEVAATAVETLTRLKIQDRHVPVLDRLVSQPSSAVSLRVSVIKALGSAVEGGSGRRSSGKAAMTVLVRLADDPENRVALAAVKELTSNSAPAAVVRTALDKLVERGLADDAIQFMERRAQPDSVPFLIARLNAAKADADKAALALADLMNGWNQETRAAVTKACADPELRKSLVAPPAGTAVLGRTVLAAYLGVLPTAEAVARLGSSGADADLMRRAIAILAEGAPDVPSLLALAGLAARDDLSKKPDATEALLKRAIALAARSPALIGEVVTHGQDLLDSHDSDSDSSGKLIRRTIKLKDGAKVVVVTDQPTGPGGWDEDDMPWRLEGAAPAGGPDAAQLATLIAAIEVFPIPEKERPARDLVLAWMALRDPDPGLASQWQEQAALCHILAARHPTFATAVRQRIAADAAKGSLHSYYVRGWLRGDDGPVIEAMLITLAKDSSVNDYELQPVVQAMEKLPPEKIRVLMPRGLAIKGFAAAAKPLLKNAGPLPLDMVLTLVEGSGLGDLAIAPITDDAVPVLVERLGRWSPGQVLSRGAVTRKLRAAGQKAVDTALKTLLAKGDINAAAWLRTGLPLEAGMGDAYRAAEGSAVPELALAGSVLALKEERLAPVEFLKRVAAWPPEVQTAAGAAAQRYLDKRWDGTDDAAAALVAVLAPRSLATWIAYLPPSPRVAEAIAGRAADPVIADAIGGALLQRLTREHEAWEAPVRAIAAAAGGRLDWINGGVQK